MSKVIVHKPSRSLIIPHNEEVLDTIPRSKTFEYKGRTLTQVYHGESEVNNLRKLGIDAPAPILSYYEWPKVKGVFDPFAHQRTTAEFITLNRRGFVLNSLGTGKTESALYAADYLMSIGKVKKCLILSPLSTIRRVWADAMFQSFHHRTSTVLYGPAAKRKELLQEDVDFYIVNFDGVKVLREELLKRDDIDMIIVDEAAVLRTGTTKLYETVKELVGDTKRLMLLTGTPTPNGPENAWALARLVSPTRVPKYFGSWKRSVMYQVSQFRWVPTKDSHQKVHEALQPAVRFTLDECIDLPEMTYQNRECELTPEQNKLFAEMRKEMEVELASGVAINAVNGADKILKILQIVGGSIKDPAGDDYHDIDCQNRMNTLLEVIEESEKKVIVFAGFTGALRRIVKELKKHKISSEYVDGSVSSNRRNEIFETFQNTRDIKVLVANPRTASHGLTLTAASTIVWWTPVYSLESYLQANGRVRRPGQTSKSTVVNLGSTPFEWSVYKMLLDKDEHLNSVLDLYKKIVETP